MPAGPRPPKASVGPPPTPSISQVTGRTWERDGARGTRPPWQLALLRVWACARQAVGAEEHVRWARGPGGTRRLGAPGVRASPRVWAEPRRRSLPRLNVHALRRVGRGERGPPAALRESSRQARLGAQPGGRRGPGVPAPGWASAQPARPRRALGRARLPTLVAMKSDISALPVCARMHAGKGRTSALGGCRAGARGLLFHRTEALGARGPGPG